MQGTERYIWPCLSVCMITDVLDCHGFNITKEIWEVRCFLLEAVFETIEKLNSRTCKNCMCTADPFMFL